MAKKIVSNTSSFFVGLLFALGLGISGMTQPDKVIGFLDIFGKWDPSLLFVMIGATGVHGIAYRFIRKRESPFFHSHFHLPTRKDVKPRLVVGSMMFGIGWGIAGICPGPGLTSLATGKIEIVVFIATMFLGMFLFRKLDHRIPLS
jgi:uncharacterized protein